MKFEYTGRHIEVTPALRSHVENHFERINHLESRPNKALGARRIAGKRDRDAVRLGRMLRETRPAWMRRAGRWIAPAALAGGASCEGSCDGCSSH